MGMFDRYDNLNPDYIPNNTTNYIDRYYVTINSDIPRPLYDIKQRFIGYTWDRNERFNFEISANDMITVRENSLIYDKTGEAPDKNTVAEVEGQKAYNVVDAKSWTFVGKTNNLYIWVEDTELIYPINGDKSIVIYTDMTNSYIELNICNFRWETLHTQIGEVGNSTIVLNIDDKISEVLTEGIYYVTLKICSENEKILKNRFMINIV